MQRKNRVRVRINYKKVLFLILSIFLFALIVTKLFNLKLANVYIHNNKYIYINNNGKYNEQQILEMAGVDDYPRALFLNTNKIKKRLMKDIYIKDAIVYKKNFTELHIKVLENRPLFYNTNTDKTILETKDETSDKFNVPLLVNYIPNELYDKFVDVMADVDDNILNYISEIKYDPNNVDEERFLFTMTDGNYVYINIQKFYLINNYFDIISEIPDKKGILYLDYGDHFVFE